MQNTNWAVRKEHEPIKWGLEHRSEVWTEGLAHKLSFLHLVRTKPHIWSPKHRDIENLTLNIYRIVGISVDYSQTREWNRTHMWYINCSTIRWTENHWTMKRDAMRKFPQFIPMSTSILRVFYNFCTKRSIHNLRTNIQIIFRMEMKNNTNTIPTKKLTVTFTNHTIKN